MKETEDKHLQEAAEKGMVIPGHQRDIETYKSLFSALQKEDDRMPSLSPSFAEKIAHKLGERAAKKEFFREYIWKIIVIAVFIGVAIIVLTIFNMASQTLQSLDAIKEYLVIAVVFIFLADLADKKFVRKVI